MTLCCAGELNGLTNEFPGFLHLPVGVLGHFQNPVGLGGGGVQERGTFAQGRAGNGGSLGSLLLNAESFGWILVHNTDYWLEWLSWLARRPIFFVDT